MAEYTVIVQGVFPSLNEFIDANRRSKGRWNKGNQMKQRDQRIICGFLAEQLHKVHIDKPVYIEYTFYEFSKRRDLDNIASYFMKVFQDALVYCGILHNDSWQYVTGFSTEFFVDSKNPRIEVKISEVEKH